VRWKYTVEVVTGSLRGAGTPNMATMQIFGSNAVTGIYRIGDDGDNLGGPGFMRDGVKQYTITTPVLGALKRIHIKKDLQTASELGSGWFLERITVTAPDGNYTTFPCHAWIGEPDDGSGHRAHPSTDCLSLPSVPLQPYRSCPAMPASTRSPACSPPPSLRATLLGPCAPPRLPLSHSHPTKNIAAAAPVPSPCTFPALPQFPTTSRTPKNAQTFRLASPS
jgi:hypothetical protein